MNLYRNVKKVNTKRDLDVSSWSGPTISLLSYETSGTGLIETELLDLRVVYEDIPFFSYGAELVTPGTLIDGDYPKITCGVAAWETTTDETVDINPTIYYIGAYLWISVDSLTAYDLRFRLMFEGLAMRNPEFFRGAS